MAWEKSGGDFVESDVVEWTETIWPPNSPRRRKKPRPWGKQKVTAQTTVIEGKFVRLIILKSEITENLTGAELKPHKLGSTFTKKRSTLLRGKFGTPSLVRRKGKNASSDRRVFIILYN